MPTVIRNVRHIPSGTNEDPFHDPLMIGIGLVFAVMAVLIVLLTGLIHWGVEYQSPPWNANSYPPPVVHRW